ncbi:MAG: FAD-binding protein [Haloplanus sp.]
MADDTDADVLVVGGGVAGLTAATFTARAGLDTLVVSDGESILRRNAHLENVPGFPAGVNPRQYADLLEEGARRNGCRRREGRVTRLERVADGGEEGGDGADGGDAGARFEATVETVGTESDADAESGGGDADDADADAVTATAVVAASWSDASYLDGVDVARRTAGSKTFLQPDRDGRTGVEGLYAAGRLAESSHQTVVAAGDGARAALSLVHDSDVPFYHDWVVPEGYFTGRGREVPPGCEEIDAAEREHRAAESRAVMRERFADPHPDDPTPHPSQGE